MFDAVVVDGSVDAVVSGSVDAVVVVVVVSGSVDAAHTNTHATLTQTTV